MSRQKKIEDISVGELSEDSITEYLENNLDFFEGRENLLMNLQLSHHQGSGAISLVERQVEVLRESNLKFKQQLKEIVVAAKDNHKVLDKIHQLALRLIESPSSVKRIQILQSSLKKDFLADRCVLIIFSSKVKSVFSDNDFTTFIDPSDKRLSPFESFLQSGRPRCVQLKDSQKKIVFSDDAPEINSAALIPLGNSEMLGFMVIGSIDSDYFNPGKGMDLLTRLGELVVAVLKEK